MMIQSVGYALSWEYWRRGMYWFVPACALLLIGFVTPIYGLLSIRADVRAELSQNAFGVICWAPLVISLASRGALRRQYTLPVRTSTLVAWGLANGSLAAASMYWLVAASFNRLFHVDWPFWGPAWWAVVFYLACQTTVWSVAGARGGWLIPIVFVTFVVSVAGPSSLYQRIVPTTSGNGAAPVWPTISAAELAATVAAAFAFYWAAVYVVGRDRRGDAWSLAWLIPGWWKQRANDGIPAPATAASAFTPRRFRSPCAAQFWMEWRSKGRYVPLAIASAFAVLWVAAACNRLPWHSVSAAEAGLTAALFMTSPFVGVYLGHRSERFDMKPFLATRPLTDRQQSMVVLGHVAAVYGASALVWVTGIVVTAMVWNHQLVLSVTWQEMARFLLNEWLESGIILLVFWTFLAFGAALGMARSWFVPVGAIAGPVLLVFALIIGERAPNWLATATMFLLAAGSAGGTVAAFVVARRRKLISMPVVLGVLAVHVLLVLVSYLVARSDGVTAPGVLDSLKILLLFSGWYAVPLAPLAVAPLALAWNRHR